MKIYLYDEKSGIFQGETFEEGKSFNFLAGATHVPPPAYGEREIPVYDAGTRCWIVISTTDARKLLSEDRCQAATTGDSCKDGRTTAT